MNEDSGLDEYYENQNGCGLPDDGEDNIYTGPGSGEDDFADFNGNEVNDYANEGGDW